jgi:hypothetical protein
MLIARDRGRPKYRLTGTAREERPLPGSGNTRHWFFSRIRTVAKTARPAVFGGGGYFMP